MNYGTPEPRRSLFPPANTAAWGHWTDQTFTPPEADPASAGCRVEQHIARLKDSGGKRFPFQEPAG